MVDDYSMAASGYSIAGAPTSSLTAAPPLGWSPPKVLCANLPIISALLSY